MVSTPSLQIDAVVLRAVSIPLKEPFTSNHGVVTTRDVVIVEVIGEGISGFGEAATLPLPGYSTETQASALGALRDRFVPLLFAEVFQTPRELATRLGGCGFAPIARAGLEMACWDWWAQAQKKPLFRILGGSRNEIPVGVAVPLLPDRGALFAQIALYLEAGYQRIKTKLSPGSEETLRDIVSHFGPIPLMVDANGAYARNDIHRLEAIDDVGLMMIEQPLPAPDLVGHRDLQRRLATPLCLDESITDIETCAEALRLNACRIINIKPGRVGGTTVALAIHDRAAEHGCGVWCGGLLETGIGRAHNIALATLPHFRYPGDISASSRYFERDIITPEVTLAPRGTIKVPEVPGIGYAIDRSELARRTTAVIELTRTPRR